MLKTIKFSMDFIFSRAYQGVRISISTGGLMTWKVTHYVSARDREDR